MIRLLLIEDEEFDVRRVTKTVNLQKETFEIDNVVSDGKSAIQLIKGEPDRFDIVIMDFQIAGGLMGEDLIKAIKEINPCIQILVITKLTLNDNKFEFANRLIETGAFWYCTKYPTHIKDFIYQPTDFLLSLHNAYQKKVLQEKSMEYSKKINDKINTLLEEKKIIGNSPLTKELVRDIYKYAKHDVNILIRGESGTGKELVAYNIHYNSLRRFDNFVAINCGSIPADLIESELFGYKKGAFTGAYQEKKGLFETADKGTIFLDEVAELPLKAQVKLLRVLQDGEIEKIGRTGSQKVDVRVIAATNKDLELEVKEKRFREDLYYRLNIIQLKIPSLRHKKEDIPELLDFYLSIYSNAFNRPLPVFTDEATERLMNYKWPGNIRELKSFSQRILFVDSIRITGDLVKSSIENTSLIAPDEVRENKLSKLFNRESIIPLKDFDTIAKSEYIQFVREYSKSDTEAADKLGVAQPNFSRLVKTLNLR
ncbi:MAG: sigma-54 dependent transcriptional regulator [Ignavibacteria bacterium]|jgi:DNA-binding NtrC family response regulator